MYNKYYREDLLSELALLSQVKFNFHFLTQSQIRELPKTKNKLSEMQQLKEACKAIVQFFIVKAEGNKESKLDILGDESQTREIGSLVRYQLIPALESVCNHGIRIKYFAYGRYHIWNLIETAAAFIRKNLNKSKTAQGLIYTVDFVVQNANINEAVFLYKDVIMFTLFVCVSMNQRQLANYFELCLSNERVIKEFYEAQSMMNNEQVRKLFIKYLRPFDQLPFKLRT
jgi:hypothetical protein